MIAAVDWQQLLIVGVGALLTGGGIGAFLKFVGRQNAGTFTIEAAKGVTVMQNTFIETLQGDYDRISKENRELNTRVQSLEAQVSSFGRMHERIEQLTREKAALEKRVEHLEQENTELRAQIEQVNSG